MVIYKTYQDFAQNVYNLMNEVLPIFPVVQAALAAEMVLNPAWAFIDMSEEEINLTLKKLTGMTVATGSDLNCYPRGLDDTLCFDVDGNPIP